MSKPNRRKEIKQKEELQARFQFSLAQTNKLALNWLKPLQDQSTKDATPDSESESSFYDMCIIPQGSGLLALERKDVSKIGDFINSNDLKKSNLQESENIKKSRTTTSKPMLALMNKMRDGQRSNIKKNYEHQRQQQRQKPQYQQIQKSQTVKPSPNDQDSDSDEEDRELLKSRSVKKGANIMFGGKLKGKKGGRPF